MGDSVESTTLVILKAPPFQGADNVLGLAFKEGANDNRFYEAIKARYLRNGETFDKAVDALVVQVLANATAATGVGSVEAQQTTSPGRTGTPEAAIDAEGTANAGVSTSNLAVAASIGKLSEALVPIIEATGGIVTAQTLAAMLAVVVTAVGGASTPSQTQAKPAA